jgi:hypothetical protein
MVTYNVILALQGLRQEDCKFEDSVGYIAKTLPQKINKKSKYGEE